MRAWLKILRPYAMLFVVLVVAYLPVTTFYFGMKNDAFSDNFPNKFFLSQALHSGNMPLWNPYLNFGFPIYADMGFAFYNPITWFFAALGYNAYTLTAEVLLYIYFAGIFMFRLGRCFNFTARTSLAVAAMYMCSGFYVGCLQYINFLTAAAFLPLVLQALLRLFNRPGFKTSFWLAVACYGVFAGGHPAIPIGTAYFVVILSTLLFIFAVKHRQNAKRIILYSFVSFGLLLVFCLPAVYSYASILPYYGRSAPLQQSLYTQAGFNLPSCLSFLFPFATAANSVFFNTDVAMRNGFFSLAGFFCVLLAFKVKQQMPKVMVLAGLVMLLLSMGGVVKPVVYGALPLLNYIRYNGELRVFSILCFCVAAGFGLERLNSGHTAFTQWFKILVMATTAVSIGVVIFIFVSGQLKGLVLAGGQASFQQKIKAFLAAPFPWFFMVSAVITAAICLLSLWALKRKSFSLLVWVVMADLAVNSIMYLPVTGVGQVTLKSIQGVYNTSPVGMPIPPLTPINAINTLDAKTTGLVGDLTYYNKLIGTQRLTDYPSYFTATDQYFNDLPLVAQVSKKPYLFLKNDSAAHISVVMFGAGRIRLTVNASRDDTIVFLQNNYPFWHAAVNGKPQQIETAFKTFMSVKISKGQNDLVFYYQDVWLIIYTAVSVLAFLVCVFLATRKFIGKQPAHCQ